MNASSEARGFRLATITIIACVVVAPVALIIYQSLLTGPFFDAKSVPSFEAFRYIFSDPEFWTAFLTTIQFSIGLVAVALPTGAVIAFLLTRTNIRFGRFLEGSVLVPIYFSPLVLAFGYTVAAGPSGFISQWFRSTFGFVPWDVYGLPALIVIGGLTHVPYVYLYISSSMRNIPGDLEEAARTVGASVFTVAARITFPLVVPAIVYAAALNVLLAFESFGLPLVLGEPNDILVLTTYLYKIVNVRGVPAYDLMAAVAVVLLIVTLPLVVAQRRILKGAKRFTVVTGKGARPRKYKLSPIQQFFGIAFVGGWLCLSVVIPTAGVVLRAFVDSWGIGVPIFDHLTTANFSQLFRVESLHRGLVNTGLIAVVGGAIACFCYVLIALAGHRKVGAGAAVLDYVTLLPRALPGLVIGLSFFWLFLFVPGLSVLRTTLISILVAYIVVGLSYGLRLIQAALLQVSPELEEAGRTTGAGIARVWRSVTLPIIRPGLAGAWVLIMILFLREYAAGVYLMTSGTEVVGSLMVSLLASGDLDTVAALSVISVAVTSIGLALANRLGVSSNG